MPAKKPIWKDRKGGQASFQSPTKLLEPSGKHVELICCSDLHLSHTCPSARTAEPSWYDVMDRYLGQLVNLSIDDHGDPIEFVFAGDIFHTWNEPAELINFVLNRLPKRTIVIPGQHDLPHHNLDDFKRSALFTLIEAGVVTYLQPNKPIDLGSVMLHGFPFGTEIKPFTEDKGLYLHVAVIHSYIWTKKTGYVGASKDQRLTSYRNKLKGYDIAVFGDNHNGFLASSDTECTILNCGGFLRRRKDEKDYKPSVGLVHSDGTIKRHYLDTSKDKFTSNKDLIKVQNEGIEGFMEELESLGEKGTDFVVAVKRYLETHEVSDGVKKELIALLEGDNNG